MSKLSADRAYAGLVSMTLEYDRFPPNGLVDVRTDTSSVARKALKGFRDTGKNPTQEKLSIWVGAHQVDRQKDSSGEFVRRLGNTTYDYGRDALVFQPPEWAQGNADPLDAKPDQ